MVWSIWLRLCVGNGTSSVRTVSRCGGSQAVMMLPKGPAPPWRGSYSTGHSQPPLPLVIASHIRAGGTSTSYSRAISNSLGMMMTPE